LLFASVQSEFLFLIKGESIDGLNVGGHVNFGGAGVFGSAKVAYKVMLAFIEVLLGRITRFLSRITGGGQGLLQPCNKYVGWDEVGFGTTTSMGFLVKALLFLVV